MLKCRTINKNTINNCKTNKLLKKIHREPREAGLGSGSVKIHSKRATLRAPPNSRRPPEAWAPEVNGNFESTPPKIQKTIPPPNEPSPLPEHTPY